MKKKKASKKKVHSSTRKIKHTTGSKVLKKPHIRLRRKVKVIRVPTGIKGFDKLIGGGFEEGSINLAVGGNGSGKTIFTMQFLMEGIRRKEPTLYITFEESKEEFYKNMLEFGWDLKSAESSGKFVFLEYSPEKVKMMLEEGGGTIESIVLKNKIRRIVIDSISSFTLLFEDEASKRHSVLSLFDILRKWNSTIVLTQQKDPLSDPDGASAEELQADSTVNFYYTKVKNKRERFLEIIKMRGTNHSKDTYTFEIGKKGMVIKKKANIKMSQKS